MKDDLENEVEALNSIYGDGTLVAEGDVYVLRLPERETSFRLQFEEVYPDVPPTVLGIQSTGENSRKGYGHYLLDVFRDAVGRVWQPGEVCLYDVVEEVTGLLAKEEDAPQERDDLEVHDAQELSTAHIQNLSSTASEDAPPWTISDVLIEMKSVFVARSAPVSSVEQAKSYVQHLLDTDKKVAKATHNITAWRIQRSDGVTYQDCDDDGEDAAGGRLLHLMQLMDLWNVMVVVTRWYGGQKLGPARFGCINSAARDSFVKAGLVQEQGGKGGDGKKKGKR
jgi:hypothetical protein